jgi:hypothetical protein
MPKRVIADYSLVVAKKVQPNNKNSNLRQGKKTTNSKSTANKNKKGKKHHKHGKKSAKGKSGGKSGGGGGGLLSQIQRDEARLMADLNRLKRLLK